MSMVVQHNMQAINSNRMLGITTSAQSKSTEKLSSGYRINRAADDAAGLTISEKMRKQVRGLNRASTNAQDGVSAVQTAEGALTEVHSMLQRMNELAVQASNGTNSEADRQAIQAEVDQLSTEIDRVAETTKFNEIYLLKGDAGTKTINMKAHDAGLVGTLEDNGNGKATFTMKELATGDSVNIGGKNYKIVGDGTQKAATANDYSFTEAKAASVSFVVTYANSTNLQFKTNGMAAAIAGNTTGVTDLESWVEAINKDANFSKSYTASLSEDGASLVVTANSMDVDAATIAADIDLTNTKNNNTAITANDLTKNEAVEASFTRTGDVKLYAKDGTEALDDAAAQKELENNGTLYTTPGVKSTQTAADAKLVEAKAASISFDVAYANSTNLQFKTNGMAAAIAGNASGVTDLESWVEAINKDANFSKSYTASLSEDGASLVVTANSMDVDAATIAADIDLANTKNNNTAITANDITQNEAVAATYETTEKSLYAANGTEALTDEEIVAALQEGKTLYSDKAGKADNEITAEEAYKLAKEELLKANQIGDTKGTAKVEAAAANEPAKAEDFKVGEKVKIGEKEYTIGSKASDLDAILDKIEETEKAGTANTPIKISFTNDKGKQEWTITPNATANTAAQIQQTSTDGNTTTATATYQDIKDALAANAGLEITIESTRTDIQDQLGTYTIGDDASADSMIITAEKAAEMKNAEPVEGGPNVFHITTGSADVAKTLSFNLHVGSDADMNNKIQVDIDTMNSEFLGVKNLDVIGKDADGKSINDGGISGTYAIDAIADAIAKVSAQRSALGAVQNRLEHTISNLDNVVENTTAAESRIRDTDMAEEMVEYSKNNILAQAGQSMLAQANQSTQGVLSLLG